MQGPDEPASKSELKRQMHALQTLGEQLVGLNADQFARLDLPDELRDAVAFAHRVSGREARRRHMQYLGKLMRRVDADSIRASLERVTGESRVAVSLMHRAESWRDRLLDDDQALTAFITENPDADVQGLRAAIRAARREREIQQPPRHSRELYRRLHQHLEGTVRTGTRSTDEG
ncbi:MAG: ribosome biogenesis factor YjgA [Burkholderiaceae bacterium]